MDRTRAYKLKWYTTIQRLDKRRNQFVVAVRNKYLRGSFPRKQVVAKVLITLEEMWMLPKQWRFTVDTPCCHILGNEIFLFQHISFDYLDI